MTGKIDDVGIGGIIQKLAQRRRAAKALAIGAAAHHDWLVALARGLRADGVLIVFYPDPQGMRALRSEFDRAGVATRANVMLGDPGLLVKKVAGPFDIVLNCESGDEDTWRGRLTPLLAPGGLLIAAVENGIHVSVA